ncbi:DUF4142 domain-containing protein [Caballeronia sp. GAWG2-1]|jgi:putative membrane protein|uniref:DUF4142 domain-containing protein n=1 Tax=Caballeronia sp. GAWG2-1 TaxID=2921744 RepID=UPI00202775D4|nr:DUF4142 domain-containing protein [Caballeronia sp. GAWG2-1]
MRQAITIRTVASTLLLLLASLHAFAQSSRPSDAQMLGILLVANQAEIATGQLALRRTQSRSVQSFASRMVSEHGQVYQEGLALLQRLGAEAQPSGVSDDLTRQTRDDLQTLDNADARDFDLTYLNREVFFLQQLVKSVDGFIRSTASADLKTLLVRSRPSFILQLDQAHRLQLALDRPGFSH